MHELVCKPTNGMTRVSFNRYISDEGSSDNVLLDDESDDNKTSVSMEDMVNGVKQYEVSGASVDRRGNLQKEPSFLFQRIAIKSENELRAKRNQTMKGIQNDKDPSLKEEDEAVSSNNPPFSFSPKTTELRKLLSSCLLLTLPSLICLCIALVLLLLVRNNGDRRQIASSPSSSPTFTVAPSSTTFSAPPAVLLETDSAASTRDVNFTKEMGPVHGTIGATAGSTEKEEVPRLIGLIDSPMDPDELILLVKTDPDFPRAALNQEEKRAPILDMSIVREITSENGNTIYCNVRVDEMEIVVECRLNEETCRVYDCAARSSYCQDGESSS